MSDTKNNNTDADKIKQDSLQGGDDFSMPVFQKPKSFRAGMGRLLRYLKPWRWQIILALLFSAVSTVMAVLAPRVVGELSTYVFRMVDQVIPGTDIVIPALPIQDTLNKILGFVVLLIVYYALDFTTFFLQGFTMAGASAKAVKTLRNDISTKINRVPLGYYDKVGFGDVLSRTTNDASTIGQSLNEGLIPVLAAIMLIVGLIIAMFVASWQMALIAISTVPISFALLAVVMSLSQKYQKQQRDYLGSLNSQVEENYSGQVVVMAFRGQGRAQKHFGKINSALARSAYKSEFLTGMMFPIMAFIGNLGFIAVTVGGVVLMDKGIVSDPGKIIEFMLYARLFMSPFGSLAQGMGMLQSGAAASERVFEFLDEKEQPVDKDKRELDSVRGDVQFDNVKFGYTDEKMVIKGFSASVKAGQKIAIVGPTGAGKTTLINLMMRFYEYQDGQISIDGVPITDMARAYVRSLFGMVLQDTWMFEGTIKENLIYAKQGITDEQVTNACKATNIHHFIMTLPGGYDYKISDETNISIGQRQLITIARAMIQDAPILILDEATSNVDTRTELHIQEAMDKVSHGRTSFVIAHRLSTIKNADLILVLREGDIVESGNHDQLIAQGGFYEELYNSQFVDENAE